MNPKDVDVNGDLRRSFSYIFLVCCYRSLLFLCSDGCFFCLSKLESTMLVFKKNKSVNAIKGTIFQCIRGSLSFLPYVYTYVHVLGPFSDCAIILDHVQYPFCHARCSFEFVHL